jgi:hypothetical protein
MEGPGFHFVFEIFVDAFDNEIGLSVPQHRLTFHDGTFLEFNLIIDVDLVPTEYSFHFQVEDGPMIWRKDLHPGHEELGGLSHIHSNSDDSNDRTTFHIVEMDEVLGQVEYYQRAT